jgi:signal transduction histidine kinase
MSTTPELAQGKPTGTKPLIRASRFTSQDLDRSALGQLSFGEVPPALVLGFVSPHVDFDALASAVISGLAPRTPVVLVSTAGELCSHADQGIYHATEGAWDNVVLQSFSTELVQEVSVHAVPLHSQDIRTGTISLSHDQRIAAIRRELERIRPPFDLDCRDTLALLFIDGLSASENYLMEAIYRTARFPVLFIGGSAGGTLDFVRTQMFDGSRVIENHAVIVFVKLAPGKRYGIFKTQNFRKTGLSFPILDGDPVRRTVTSVFDRESLEAINFIDALCSALGCEPEELDDKMKHYSFAVELDDELFVRSVATIDRQAGCVRFYCDVNPGDELHLVEATDFIEQTTADFAAFMRGKPRPLGALLNDCILRRLNNPSKLGEVRLFGDIPLAGFSTFGELLGININQTLTSVFFFEEETPGTFHDDYVDRFPIHYARFQSYFIQTRHNRLSMLNRIRQSLIELLIVQSETANSLGGEVEKISTYAERVANDDFGAIASAAVGLLAQARRAASEREAAIETLHRREAEYQLSEERRRAAEMRAELEAQLLQARKMEAVGNLAGGVAHEINNMLLPIVGLTKLTCRGMDPESAAYRRLAVVLEAAQKAQLVTQQLLAFSRNDHVEIGPIALTEAVRGAEEMVRMAVPKTITMNWRIEAEDMTVRADSTQVTQVLINLARNSADAMGDTGGTIEIALERVRRDGAASEWEAALSVRDDGCGMDEEIQARIFDPFFTTKEVGAGTGLGLSVVHGIAKSWGGTISVNSRVGEGTLVTIRLPLLQSAEEGAPAE